MLYRTWSPSFKVLYVLECFVLSFRSGLWGWQAVRGKGTNTLGSRVSQSMRKIRSLHLAWKRSNSDQSVLTSTVIRFSQEWGGPAFSSPHPRGFSLGSAGSIHRELLQGPHQPLVVSPITLSWCPLQTLGLHSLLDNSRLHSGLGSTPAAAIFILLCVIPAGSKRDARP